MLSKSILKNCTLSTFHRAIDETLKIPEKCWPFLYLNFTRVNSISSTLSAHAYKMVITTECVQMTAVSVLRDLLSISVRH